MIIFVKQLRHGHFEKISLNSKIVGISSRKIFKNHELEEDLVSYILEHTAIIGEKCNV